MSESSISKRVPDPAVRVSTTDGHRMLTPPGQPEPERPGQVQRPAQRQLVEPRRPPLTDTGRGRARPVSPLPAAPSGVVLGQSASVFSTVSKGARVSTPPRTPAHVEIAQRRATERAAVAAPHGLDLSDAELAFVGSLVQTFAATAGGEGLALAQAVGAKLAAEVEARDASEPATPPEAPQAPGA